MTADPSRGAPGTGAPGIVVVTGVSRLLGAHVAARLANDPRVGRVIGLDAAEPSPELAAILKGANNSAENGADNRAENGAASGAKNRVEHVRADTREAATAIADLDAEAVVHLDITTAPDRQNGGRAAMKEQNVIGTMQLLAACQQAPRLRKLVIRSSTAAYGASFRDPAVFTEDTEPREVPRGGFARDILDLEGYVRGFRRRRPHVIATVLRFAPFIGSQALTTLTRYFAQPVVPTVLGRDPRLQFVHVDDALEVLHRSVVEDHSGTFNVAGPGVLALSQAIRRAGRIAAPVIEPGLSAAAGLARGFGGVSYGFDQLDLFVHGRVVDITRLIQEYDFTPRTTAAAFDDFIRGHEGGTILHADQLAAAEQAILQGIRKVRGAMRKVPAVSGGSR
jgi:UDP-glucose 4-epimerase